MPRGVRRPRKEKLAAVMAAEMAGVVQAERQTGIPEETIRYWLQQPEFAEFRAKTREDMENEVRVVAHLAWKRVAEALRSGDMEARDALFAADKATTILQLVTGEATSRSEHRELLNGFDDGEVEAVTAWLREIAAERVHADD